MGVLGDIWAEEREIIHAEALERPVRIAERRARRAVRARLVAEADAALAAAELRAEQDRLAAFLAEQQAAAARGQAAEIRAQLAGATMRRELPAPGGRSERSVAASRR